MKEFYKTEKLLTGIKEEQAFSRSAAGDRLSMVLQKRKSTLLGIGPMSKNCVDATIELGEEGNIPLMLIASRRQVDSAELGGGYVNGWTTESFAEYVKERDKSGNMILARDHGGPWQNSKEVEKKLSVVDAMESCKRSYEVDIKSGFEIIHLDPSVDIHTENPREDVIMDRLFELYEHCYMVARKFNKEIIIEIGTEEQTGAQHNIGDLEVFLDRVINYCGRNNLPKPYFVVVQTGTKVKETGNVGNLGIVTRVKGLIPPEVHIAKLVEVCEKYGVRMKEHNTDYLPDETLSWHPQAGIHSANVAPEFGVVETRHVLKICKDFELRKEKDDFLRVAFESRKWEKWLVTDSKTSDYDKAVMAGHYVLNHPEVLECKERIKEKCSQQGLDFDLSIKENIKHVIRRYLLNFNLL